MAKPKVPTEREVVRAACDRLMEHLNKELIEVETKRIEIYSTLHSLRRIHASTTSADAYEGET